MTRCEAIRPRTGRCRNWGTETGEACLCSEHRYRLLHKPAIRLTGNRQLRRTYDITGRNPQLQIAYMGFDTRQEQTA
jgi:hypothetical protein